MVNSIILARGLEVDGYGKYILAITTVHVLTVPAAFGLPTLITRYFTQFDTQKEFGKMKTLFYRANLLVLGHVGLLFLVFLGVDRFQPEDWGSEWRDLSLIGLGMLTFILLSLLRAAALRGLRFVVLGLLPELLLRNIFLLAGLAYCWFYEISLNPTKAMLVHSIAVVLAFVLGAMVLHRKVRSIWGGISLTSIGNQWYRESFTYAMIGSIQMAKSRIVTYLLAIFAGVEAVAIFDIAKRFGSMIAKVTEAIHSGVAPFIAYHYSSGKIRSIQLISDRVSSLNTILAVPGFLLLLLLGSQFLQYFFGQEYDSAYLPMIIVAIACLFDAFSGPLAPLINMTGHQAYFGKNQLVFTGVLVAIAFPLIIQLGVIGAALTFGVVLFLQNITLIRYVQRAIGIQHWVFKRFTTAS